MSEHQPDRPEIVAYLREQAETLTAAADLLERDAEDQADAEFNVRALLRRAEEAEARVAELEQYEQQLTRAAENLQSLLPIGEVKAIGLLEVSAGILELAKSTTLKGRRSIG